MQFSRRSFLTASALAGALAKMPSVEALIHHAPSGQKGQVNLNNQSVQIDFGYLNLAKGSLGFNPQGGTPTQDPWALLNSDGYPTAIPTGSTVWRADTTVYYIDAESFFSGSVSGTTLTVTGSVTGKPLFVGQTVTQTLGGTALTAQSRITAFGTGTGGAGTYTLSQSTASTGAINMTAFIPWVCDWVGNVSLSASASTNGSIGPNYGVVVGSNRVEINVNAINRTGATFNLSLTAGSSTATLSSISGTLFPLMKISGTNVPPFTQLGFGSGTSWPLIMSSNGGSWGSPNTLSYALSSVACTGSPIAMGDPVNFTIQISSITSTPSNIRVYRQDQETLLTNGQISAPHFINFYKKYGRLRFMNWQTTNGSMLANWADRTPLTHFNWQGLTNILSTKYAGLCPANSTNAFVGLNALPGNPSSWTDKMTAQFSVVNNPSTCSFVGFIDNGAGAGSPSGVAGNTLTITSVISGTVRTGLSVRLTSNNNGPATCNITAGSGTSWTVDGSAQNQSSVTMAAYLNITGFSTGSTTTVTAPNHGFTNGQIVIFPPGEISGGSIDSNLNSPGGSSGTNNSSSYTVASATTNTFALSGIASGASFTGTISGNQLTVSGWSGLSITTGMTLYIGGVSAGVIIQSFGTGTGGNGTYTLSGSPGNQGPVAMVATTWGTYSSGGVVMLAPTFKTGLLPAKLITGIGIGNYGISGGYNFWAWQNSNVPNYLTVVYDATLDVLISNYSQGWRSGLPFEAAIQMANEVNGPDAWMCVPAFATDSFVNSLATYMKANLNSPLRWCFELANEVWNPANGFWQTAYALAISKNKWPSIVDSSGIDQWYGWRFWNMMQQVNAVYTGNSQVQRIFAYRTDGAPTGTQRATAPTTGVASNPLSLADSLCFADYIPIQAVNQTLPAAVDIYNYQQGVLTNNNTLIQSALNAMDTAFNSFSCGPLFSPITATIDNGSGSAGNILTVTAISTTGPPVPQNPRIGPYTVISSFGSNFPAVGTYVLSQLTSTEPGGTLNKRGTYQLSGPAQLFASGSFTATGSWIDQLLNTYIPYFQGLATTYSVGEICAYEGGWNNVPGSESVYTSYSGHAINLQDLINFSLAYQQSSQYATTYLNFLNAWKAAGLKFSSQYCMTEIAPSPGGMYGMVYPNIFGTPSTAKTSAFDVYNAS